MTDMGITIDGHPADIHLHLPGIYRDKSIFFSCEGIIDVYGHLLHATSLAMDGKIYTLWIMCCGKRKNSFFNSLAVNLYFYIRVVY
jgi:hypothetical protein